MTGGAVVAGVAGVVAGVVAFVVVGFGWVVVGAAVDGDFVTGAVVAGGPGATAPVGRQIVLPGSRSVAVVAPLTASSDFIETLARLAIVDQASFLTTV